MSKSDHQNSISVVINSQNTSPSQVTVLSSPTIHTITPSQLHLALRNTTKVMWLQLFYASFLLCATLASAVDLKIVQLGDSYSSGVGASGGHYERAVPECHRSSDGWGGQYANRLRGQYNVTYINGACVGAESHDLLNARFIGQTRGLCPFQRKRNSEEVFYNRTRFKLQCNKFAKPQINYVDNTTDLVIMTIGGNDALFAPILSSCILGLSVREAQKCLAIVEHARSLQVNYTNTIQDSLVEIWYKMGETGKIVIFQYPHLVQDFSVIWKDPISGVSIDGPQLVRNFTIEGNNLYSVAAEELNDELGVAFLAVYNETMDLFANHEADPRKHARNDDRWIAEFEVPIESVFHPNQKGHFELGKAAAMKGLFGLEL